MHRNTFLLVITLSVVAALLVGVNIGRRLPSTQSTDSISLTTTPSSAAQPDATPITKSYQNRFCRVAFDYPSDLILLENASGSAVLTGKKAEDGIILTCQKQIPRPDGSGGKAEQILIGSVSATLYHDQVASEGAVIDSVIFRHPGTKLDVFLAGTGEVFRKLIASLSLFP